MGIKEVKQRTDWDILMMSMAFHVAANRSLDPRTKHGCFIVDENYAFLSFGFNSPPQGCVDEEIPLEAPDKYSYFAHAEQNAIDNAAEHGFSLRNSIFYITGMPCPRCFQSIRRVKAKKIIYGPVGSHMITNKDMQAIHKMNKNKNNQNIIEMISFAEIIGKKTGNYTDEFSLGLIKTSQNKTWDYIFNKCLNK